MKRRLPVAKKTAKPRRGLYTNLEDVTDAFSVFQNNSGWVLHKYESWICFAIHSAEFEDPDIKVVVKNNLDYKVIVNGLLLDTRMPSLTKNELKTILSFAEKSLSNICCGLTQVIDPTNFNVVHRRYSYDVFEIPPEKPRYQTVFRSPHCIGQSTNGPCSFCEKLNQPEVTTPDKNTILKEKNENLSSSEDSEKLINEKSFKDEELVENDFKLFPESC